MRRNLLRWLAATAMIVGVGALVLFDLMGGGIGCGHVPIRVVGRVVDARTGEPITGAALLTLMDPEVVDDPARLARRWDTARMYEEGRGEPDGDSSYTVFGSAHAGPGGAFDVLVGLSTSSRTSATGITWRRSRSSPYNVVRALLVEADGYARLVHGTASATWREHDPAGTRGGIAGTFDVGTIRLAPR